LGVDEPVGQRSGGSSDRHTGQNRGQILPSRGQLQSLDQGPGGQPVASRQPGAVGYRVPFDPQTQVLQTGRQGSSTTLEAAGLAACQRKLAQQHLGDEVVRMRQQFLDQQ